MVCCATKALAGTWDGVDTAVPTSGLPLYVT
jgi:hypothetical protein